MEAQHIKLDMKEIDKRRTYNDAGGNTMPNRRWPELLVTLVARSTVRIIPGSGTAAPLRGMVLLVALVWLLAVRNIAAAAPTPTAVPAAAAAAREWWNWETGDAAGDDKVSTEASPVAPVAAQTEAQQTPTIAAAAAARK